MYVASAGTSCCKRRGHPSNFGRPQTVYTPAMRVVYLAFEEDGYSHASAGGLRLLTGLLRTLPDSKVIEDVHSDLRLTNQHQQTRRQTVHRQLQTVCGSRVLSSRGIPHKAEIDRELLLRCFPRTRERRGRGFSRVISN